MSLLWMAMLAVARAFASTLGRMLAYGLVGAVANFLWPLVIDWMFARSVLPPPNLMREIELLVPKLPEAMPEIQLKMGPPASTKDLIA